MENPGDPNIPVEDAPEAEPQPQPTGDNTSAFQEALKKAQELAAGLRQQADGADPAGPDQGYKRPNDDPMGLDNPAKRVMTDMNFDVAAAQAEAQARAAKIMQGVQQGMLPAGEEVRVPNRMVGIIIGKSGETINRLQADSNARIQCAPALPGNPQEGERVISVTGTAEAIAAAKMMIQALVEQGPDGGANQQPPMPGLAGGEADSTEMMIPQAKVGLIIGKGGETIKRLQQQASCHMQMIQDGPYAHAPQKPLRIQGNPQAMEHAKRLVEELMAERDAMGGGSGGGSGGGAGAPGGGHAEMPVPREMVGMVIGRGGESIKRIQAETGVRIQFSQDNAPGAVRQAVLTGPPEGIPVAQKMVSEILERAESNSRGGGGGGGSGGRFGGGGPGGPPGGGHMDVCEFPVPGQKCGLVIGRGGETIRALQHETGCHIQLNRNAQCGPDEKVFTIRGDPQQIAHAQNLIREKCDMPPGPQSNFGGNQQHQQQGGYGQNMMGGHMGGHMAGQMGGQMPGMSGQMQGMGQQQMQGQMYGQPQQQWGQYGQQQYGQPQQSQDMQAQWAQYYQQYYNQQQGGQNGQQPAMQQGAQQQQSQQPQQASQQQGAQGQQPATSSAQPATSQAQGNAADIQAQWAEYYRQMGYSYPQGQQQSQQPAQ